MKGQVEAGEEAPAGASAGFSTLEAVVAIGILGLCILPLMDFQMTVSEGAARLASRNAALEVEMRAEAYLRALPPAALTAGEGAMGAYQLVWQEEAIGPVRPALSEEGVAGRFDLHVSVLAYEVRDGARMIASGRLERPVWRAKAPFLNEGSF